MSGVKSLQNIYDTFPIDFYLELQDKVLSNYGWTFTDIEFMLKSNKQLKQVNHPMLNTLNDILEVIKSFNASKDFLAKNDIMTFNNCNKEKNYFKNYDEYFETVNVEDFHSHKIYLLSSAVPKEIAEKLIILDDNGNLLPTIDEPDINEQIRIFVQLLDENNEDLLGRDKPLPSPCRTIDDERLLIVFQFLKDGKLGLYENEKSLKLMKQIKESE